ncbi:hypothetical protein BCR43DRAFT_489736, partial [Syncephalastrum racemosum]
MLVTKFALASRYAVSEICPVSSLSTCIVFGVVCGRTNFYITSFLICSISAKPATSATHVIPTTRRYIHKSSKRNRRTMPSNKSILIIH